MVTWNERDTEDLLYNLRRLQEYNQSRGEIVTELVERLLQFAGQLPTEDAAPAAETTEPARPCPVNAPGTISVINGDKARVFNGQVWEHFRMVVGEDGSSRWEAAGEE